jgi:hypothetical protein
MRVKCSLKFLARDVFSFNEWMETLCICFFK